MDYTLLADGPSDVVLMGPLNWLLQRHNIASVNGHFADPLSLPPLSEGLVARIEAAVREFPCDLLFVHRDAEREPHRNREQEILSALAGIGAASTSIPVVPVRMTEAWFLFDEKAIRRAANNPNGTDHLNLPSLRQCESVPSAKDRLTEALRKASGLSGRGLARFDRGVRQSRRRVADYIIDYTPLLGIHSFGALDNRICALAPLLRG